MCAISSAGIETDRLTLRAPRASDAVVLADRVNDFDIARMTTHVPHPYALSDAQAFLEAAERKGDPVFVVDHPAFGPIGMLGFHEAPLEWSPSGCALSPEVGYWLARTFWGQGFATEALSAALAWAETALPARAVMAGHFTDNPASARVLEKAGFLYTGEVQARFSHARGAVAPTRMMVRLT